MIGESVVTTLREIITRIEEVFPIYDFGMFKDLGYGLQVGPRDESLRSQMPVKKVIVAMDVTARVIKEAEERKANLIITHHTFLPWGKGEEVRIDEVIMGRLRELLRERIYVYKLHESIKVTKNGFNETISEVMKFEPCKKVVLEEGRERIPVMEVCKPTKMLTMRELIRDICLRFKIKQVEYSGEETRLVENIGIYAGDVSNLRLIDIARDNKIDTLIVGEMNYRGVVYAMQNKIGVIQITHQISEKIGLKRVTQILQVELPRVEFKFIEPDPIRKVFVY